MGISFGHSAGFGKRMEYNLVGKMLMELAVGNFYYTNYCPCHLHTYRSLVTSDNKIGTHCKIRYGK